MQYVGESILRKRKDLGLSRSELGKLAGYNRGTVARVETGDTKNFEINKNVAEAIGLELQVVVIDRSNTE